MVKNRKKSPPVLIPYRNQSGVVELVGLDRFLFAKVENNSVTKSGQNFRQKIRKKQFWLEPITFEYLNAGGK